MKNIKSILLVMLMFFLLTPVEGKTFTPKPTIVKYNVTKAKTEAFKGVPRSLPLSYFKTDLHDNYHNSNMSYLKDASYKTKSYEPTRDIIPSYMGEMLISYGVRYENKMNKVYHYNSSGKLLRIEFDNNNPQTYPKKTTTYNNQGKLHTVVFYISPSEQYNFDGKGNLIVHWIGEKAYNKDGRLMKIRRSL